MMFQRKTKKDNYIVAVFDQMGENTISHPTTTLEDALEFAEWKLDSPKVKSIIVWNIVHSKDKNQPFSLKLYHVYKKDESC